MVGIRLGQMVVLPTHLKHPSKTIKFQEHIVQLMLAIDLIYLSLYVQIYVVSGSRKP